MPEYTDSFLYPLTFWPKTHKCSLTTRSVNHRLHLIESYGTGIRKIYNLYANCSEQPRIEVTSNTFKIILPNMNRAAAKESGKGITSQMQKILDYIDENGKITELEIQDMLGLKKTRAFTLAKQMRDYGLIKVVGRGSQKVYVR